VNAAQISHEPNFGMSLNEYRTAWHNKYADSQVEFGFNSVAGYTTGLVLEKALATATSLDQLELRRAIVIRPRRKRERADARVSPATSWLGNILVRKVN
jgi:hypothetical protein